MIRVLSRQDVERLLPMNDCMDAVVRALVTTSEGDAVLPLRTKVWLPDRSGMLGLMPGFLAYPESFGLKVVSIFPGNHGTGLDSHQGIVMLCDPANGTPLAILDASSITAIRTAAASAVATHVLARNDAGDLAILGSGVQAANHLTAMRAVRTIRRVRVWSRNEAHARAFARRDPMIEVVGTVYGAVAGADIICTTTASPTPILEGSNIAEGAHINAVGACVATARELDTAAVARARLYVDRKESALAESGDFLLAKAEGAITDAHIVGELGDLLRDTIAGRTSPTEITLFKSLGIAVEDLAAARYIYDRAVAENAGVVAPLG